MKDIVAFAAVAAVSLAAAGALAESPALLPIQGHLSDAEGIPIDGARDITVTVFADEVGGAPLHTESFAAEPIDRGDFVVYLGGAGDPIDLALFRDESALWVEITVASEVIEPRLRLATAPYAGFASHCGDAATLDGNAPNSFAAATHSHAWGEVSGVPAELADGDDDTLAAIGVSCSGGELARFNGATWECGPVPFDSIDWPVGYSFLSLSACPAGFSAIESGYLKLSGTPDVTLSPRTLATPGHFHAPGTLATDSGGGHTHGYLDAHYLDSGNDPSYATGTGDDVGQLVSDSRTTASAGAHTHALSGAVGAVASGVDGDTAIAATGDLEHVSLRLCVRN
jgi:hypothetical protein